MTDYRNKLIKVLDPQRERFFKKNRIIKISEANSGLNSKNLETDSLVNTKFKFENTFRPSCTARDPSTFAFYGSAEKYYDSAFYNIVNYYPFDGTNEELIEWYNEANPLEISLLKHHWPGSVGHVKFTNSQYINFYAGPQAFDINPEYTGSFTASETPLRLDAKKGNTVEFWLKKASFDVSNHKEVIFEVGSMPGKVASQYSGKFRLFLSASSGSPFFVDYMSGSVGVNSKRIESTITTASMSDNKWHHYAVTIRQLLPSNTLSITLYKDGALAGASVRTNIDMGSVDTYMAGTIGGNLGGTDGSLSASLDEFRFWKGTRTPLEIGKYFDKRVYASDVSNTDYTSRLGAYYKFNKDPLGEDSKDRFITDFSGNGMIGTVENYSAAFRDSESAITLSYPDISNNKELLDPILDLENNKLTSKVFEFEEIGKSYDSNNHHMLSKNVPEWVYDSNDLGTANQESEVALLMHLMSTEFDAAKVTLDSILRNTGIVVEEPSGDLEDIGSTENGSINYLDSQDVGCQDEQIIEQITTGNSIDMAFLKIEDSNIDVVETPLVAATLDEEVENIIFPFKLQNSIPEIRRALLNNINNNLASMLQRKGTESAFDSLLASYGIDRNIVSYNIMGRNADIFIDDSKLDFVSEKKNSVYFGQNLSSTLFMSGNKSDERTYIQGAAKETEYTFEGTFIFPNRLDDQHKITESSIFGLAEVPPVNNSFQFTNPNDASFQVKVIKDSQNKNDAFFKLSSDSSIIADLSSPIFKDVYDNSRWNISLKVEKDIDNRFISSSNPSSVGYKVVFSGYNYVLDSLQNSFVLSASLNNAKYVNFNTANKTFYIGAQRTNITGAVQTETDLKIINFNAYNDQLSEQELKFKAQAPSNFGRRDSHMVKDNFTLDNDLRSNSLISSIQFSDITELSSTSDIRILDAASGSAKHVIKYGPIIGHKYPMKSTTFSSNKQNVIQQDFLPVVRNVRVQNVHGNQAITIKESEVNKFDLSSRPESKLFSFEKSMYQAISREMVLFLAGVSSFNNLIGEPVNKYRKSYKMIDHLRQKFYEVVENESQFERYVNYYRWIDSSIGHFLNQLVPATADANTGIENVVESHALERNKYQHKYINMKRKEPNLSTKLLSINELLYDWEHGHFDPSEDNHCLWQRDRKLRIGPRESLRKVLTTKTPGSNYVLRNLSKPYKYGLDIQKTLNIGPNKETNKIPDLYKVVNQGKNIVINSEDIYEFKKCNDEIEPGKKKRYTAKTNTTGTAGYLDADADMILPFSLYSSSVGTTFENFKSNLVITNNHDDTPALQGLFVKNFVGGYPHRNVKIGTPAENRPEAYDIVSTNSSLTIRQASGPKSMFFRGNGGASFYNIANVKTTLNPEVIGNYSEDYEIIMINGRMNNNNYFVENEGANLTGGFTTSSLLDGVVDFFVPERPARKHVIVNRFSAPGSAEADAAYGLDRESGEFSVYDTVNYRNLSVRRVLNTLSSERSERFGIRSGSLTQGSIHAVNRNPRRFTGSLGREFNSDNFYVQNMIPQTDFGYSWVTASANEDVYSFLNKNGNFGYQHNFSISGSLKSSETINFLSSSQINPDLDFVNLNTFTTRSLSIDSNTLTDTTRDLNSIVLNRQGPYGWPSWKQIRSSEHAIIRKHKKENILSAVFTGKTPFTSAREGYVFDYQRSRVNNNTFTVPRTTENYKEIMVTSKFKPLVVSVHPVATQAAVELLLEIPFRNTLSDIDVFSQYQMAKMWENDEFYQTILAEQVQQGVENSERQLLIGGPSGISATPVFSMKADVQSDVSFFANQEMADDFDHKERSFLLHKNLQTINNYISETEGIAPIRELNYIETIYPREINTYTKNARTREKFKFFGWNSSRENRNLILSGNVSYQNFIYTTPEQSMFPIPSPLKNEGEFKKSYFDIVEIIDLNSTGSSASISSSKYITGSSWVLDSRKTFSQKPIDISESFFNDGDSFLAARSQGTRGEGILQNDYSIFGLGYNGLRGRAPYSPVYNRRIPQSYGSKEYLAGEAKWEAAGSSVGPFYDDYVSYAEEARLMGQSYSIIPEFRISQFIEDIYSSDFSEDSLQRDDFLQLTGAIYHSSSGDLSIGTQFFKTYSTSDFMKYFADTQKNIKDNNFNFTEGRLTLKCSGIKRFLPYRGLYPAERLVQISELFHRGYLKEGSFDYDYIQNSGISEELATNYMNLRIENSKAQALKPLMAPGVLFNSIKSGLAVDYPIFSSSLGSALNVITGSFITSSMNSFSSLGLGASTSFTGSLINSTTDAGIPRISGSVYRRVDFNDVLEPERLFKQIMFDNEPHPSASLLYGSAKVSKVLERPSKFGILDQTATKKDIAINFGIESISFANSMLAYKSAVNNFCAETVNFFLEDQKLQSIVSEPVKPYLQKNVNYRMRVYLNNENTTMYDRHSAFGPPVDEGDVEMTKYALRDTTIQGQAATASVSFGSYTGNEIGMLDDTITVTDTAGTPVTYQFITNSIPVAATASITVQESIYLVSSNEEIGATITIPDHGGSTSKTYQFVRDVTGVTSSGSIDFTGLTKTTVSGSTITLPDFDGNNTKTYQFVNNITATSASALITVPVATNLVPINQHYGATFSLTNSAGTGIETYQFVRNITGVTSTGSIDFSGLTPTAVSGSMIRLQDFDGVNTKNYQFVNNRTAIAATASLDFSGVSPLSDLSGSGVTLQNTQSQIKGFEFKVDTAAATSSFTFALDYDTGGHNDITGKTVTNNKAPQAILLISGSKDHPTSRRKFFFETRDVSETQDDGYIELQHIYSLGLTLQERADLAQKNFGAFTSSLDDQRFTIQDVSYHPGIALHNNNALSNGTNRDVAVYSSADDPYRNEDPYNRRTERRYEFSAANNNNLYNYDANLNLKYIRVKNCHSVRAVGQALVDAINRTHNTEPNPTRVSASLETSVSMARFDFGHITNNNVAGHNADELHDMQITMTTYPHADNGASSFRVKKYRFVMTPFTNGTTDSVGNFVRVKIGSDINNSSTWLDGDDIASNFQSAINRVSGHQVGTHLHNVIVPISNPSEVRIYALQHSSIRDAITFTISTASNNARSGVSGGDLAIFNNQNRVLPSVFDNASYPSSMGIYNNGNHNYTADSITTLVPLSTDRRWHGFAGGRCRVKLHSMIGGTDASISVNNTNVAAESNLAWTNSRSVTSTTDAAGFWKNLSGGKAPAKNGELHPNHKNIDINFSALGGDYNYGLNNLRVVDLAKDQLFGPENSTFNNLTYNQAQYEALRELETSASVRVINAINRAFDGMNDDRRITASAVPYPAANSTFHGEPGGTHNSNGILIQSVQTGKDKNTHFQYLPISVNTLTQTTDAVNPIPVVPQRIIYPHNTRTLKGNYTNAGSGGTNIDDMSTAFLAGGEDTQTFTNASTLNGKTVIKVPIGATTSQVIANTEAAILDSTNGFGPSGFTINTTSTQLALTQSQTGAHNHTIGTLAYTRQFDSVQVGGSKAGFSGGQSAASYTNGQTFSGGGTAIAVEVSGQNTVSTLRSRFQSAVEAAQSGEYTFSNSGDKLVISMATTNSELPAARTIFETGAAFNNKVAGFSSGVDGLTHTSGQRLSDAVGYSNYNGTATNIAVRVGSKQTYDSAGSNFATTTIASQLRVAINAIKPSGIDSATFNSNLVHITMSDSGTAGNKPITFANNNSSNLVSSDISGFSGGIDGITYSNGQTFSGGGTNIAVEVSGQNSVSTLRSRFMNAVDTAQSGEFTDTISGDKLILSMATTNTATAATRTITEGGTAFNNKIAGFSSGVNTLTFTNGNRLDQATGWSNYFSSDTNTNIAIVVGSKITYENSATHASQAGVGGRLRDQIGAKQSDIVTNLSSPNLNLTRSVAGHDGNHTITRTNVSSSNFSFSSVSGFVGGYTGAFFTNGSAIGGGNNNIAVLIGDSTPSGVSGSSFVQNRFNSAVTTNQGSTLLVQNANNDLLGPRPNVRLIQRVSGSAGNRTITDSNFSTIDDDIKGFGGGVDFQEGTMAMIPTTSIHSSSHGYLPYVPPFLDPNTSPYVQLSIIPEESKNYTIPEILENLTASYYNVEAPSNPLVNTNYKEAMNLSASIDFKKYVKLQSDNTITVGGVIQAADPRTSDKYRWVIQPRWETPVLDFSNVTSSALNLSTNSVQKVTESPWKPRYQSNYYEMLNIPSTPYLTASTGMWHQSGSIIEQRDEKGYSILIQPESHDLRKKLGDLASACGFMDRDERRRILSGYNNFNSYKLGRLAEKKLISESVVAIPYFLSEDCEMQFFPLNFKAYEDAHELNQEKKHQLQGEIFRSIDKEHTSRIKEEYEDWSNTPGQDAIENIAYQIRMMDKYVIPPHFDFIRYPNLITPYVAYYFQFQAELSQQDLANIWQNMYPTITGSVGSARMSETKFDSKSTDVQYISGYLNTNQISMLSTRVSNYQHPDEFLEKEVRWLVFKVKRRAETFYKDVANHSIVENPMDIVSVNDVEISSRKVIKGSDQEFRDIFGKFGYNWPYDFFSLVELIKVDSKVDFYDNGGPTAVTSILRQQQGQGQGQEPMSFEIIDSPPGQAQTTTSAFTSSTATSTPFSSDDLAAVMVIREVLKADNAALPSPATRYTASTATIKANTEQVYINGVLMSHGSSNDYTISGNVITLTFDPNPDDSIVITYIKE